MASQQPNGGAAPAAAAAGPSPSQAIEFLTLAQHLKVCLPVRCVDRCLARQCSD